MAQTGGLDCTVPCWLVEPLMSIRLAEDVMLKESRAAGYQFIEKWEEEDAVSHPCTVWTQEMFLSLCKLITFAPVQQVIHCWCVPNNLLWAFLQTRYHLS